MAAAVHVAVERLVLVQLVVELVVIRVIVCLDLGLPSAAIESSRQRYASATLDASALAWLAITHVSPLHRSVALIVIVLCGVAFIILASLRVVVGLPLALALAASHHVVAIPFLNLAT
jgi:hypothetical protein